MFLPYFIWITYILTLCDTIFLKLFLLLLGQDIEINCAWNLMEPFFQFWGNSFSCSCYSGLYLPYLLQLFLQPLVLLCFPILLLLCAGIHTSVTIMVFCSFLATTMSGWLATRCLSVQSPTGPVVLSHPLLCLPSGLGNFWTICTDVPAHYPRHLVVPLSVCGPSIHLTSCVG